MSIEDILLVVALVSDVAYPLLNWKLGVPEEFRWISHAATLVLISIALFRSFRLPNIPPVWLALEGWLLFSAAQALTDGQSVAATLWGFYSWLRFPLIGLYAYTRPKRSPDLKSYIFPTIFCLTTLNLIIQLLQFFGGEIPGDNLGGFWGLNGTGRLASFIGLALSIGFGKWIVQGSSKYLWLLGGMAIFSSILAETKVFLPVIALTGVLTIMIYEYRRRKILSGLFLIFLLIASGVGFVRLYDQILRPVTRLMSYLDPSRLTAYLSYSNQRPGALGYIGRLTQVTYVWHQISKTPFVFLFGQGLGSLETSRALGSSGVGLLIGSLGVFGATTLTGLMGDFGMLGLVISVVFLTGTSYRLLNVRGDRQLEALSIGLVIFICTFPVWAFYMDIWTTPITMFVFWFATGSVLRARVEPVRMKSSRPIEAEHPRGVQRLPEGSRPE
jgi:hypothetical protein